MPVRWEMHKLLTCQEHYMLLLQSLGWDRTCSHVLEPQTVKQVTQECKGDKITLCVCPDMRISTSNWRWKSDRLSMSPHGTTWCPWMRPILKFPTLTTFWSGYVDTYSNTSLLNITSITWDPLHHQSRPSQHAHHWRWSSDSRRSLWYTSYRCKSRAGSCPGPARHLRWYSAGLRLGWLTRSFLNWGGNECWRWGMWKSPMTNTSCMQHNIHKPDKSE